LLLRFKCTYNRNIFICTSSSYKDTIT
jgi:hypothetical protein